MMIGILILGVMECVHGRYCPHNSKAKNCIDLWLILNLHTLFAVSLYTTSNSIAVNTLVAIAIVQFVTFSMYHAKVLTKNIFITSLVQLKLSLARYFRQHFIQQQPQQNIELLNAMPEVAYSYKEHEEH